MELETITVLSFVISLVVLFLIAMIAFSLYWIRVELSNIRGMLDRLVEVIEEKYH